MEYKVSYKEAEELYYKLRKVYDSPYIDSIEEMIQSVNILREALETYKEEYLVAKAKILSMKSQEYKQKLSNIIKGKYWI